VPGLFFLCFFASSFAEFKTGKDPEKVINFMKAAGMDFTLFFVPLNIKDEYRIDQFKPLVKGAVWLGTFKVK
jgi:hypothetical protein